MRRFMLMLLLVGASGCGVLGGTEPDATMINVRVRDDRGVAVGRTQVIVTLAATEVITRTSNDGSVSVRLSGGGVYRVRVIPRAGYLAATDPLSKQVTVASNARAVVDFAVSRDGTYSGDPLPGL